MMNAAEKFLREPELLSGIVDTVRDGIVALDSGQRIIMFNRAAERLFQRQADEMLGMHAGMLVPQRFREQCLQKIAGFGKSGDVAHADGSVGVFYGLRADGEEFPVEVSLSCASAAAGFAIIVILHDISDRRASEKKIFQLTSAYSALSQVNHCLVKCKSRADLFSETCRIAVDAGGMRMAWIGLVNEAENMVTPAARYGHGTNYLDGLVISTGAEAPGGTGPTAIAAREGQAIICQDYFSDPITAPYHERARPYGWHASASFPIMRAGKPCAVLSLYHDEPHSFTAEVIELMTEMAENIGHGLMLLELEESKRRVDESMRLAATIYQSSAEAVVITDENNLIIDVNPAFTRQTGYAREEVLGKNPRIFKSGNHDRAFYVEMWRALTQSGHWQGEIWDRRKDGTLYAKFVGISVIRHADGRIYRHVAQFFDVTDRKQKDEVIWTQANFDPLTELPNRRLFLDRLEQEIKKVHRSGTELGLFFIDLDRFKEVNDTMGHAKGDLLLVDAARRIKACVRDSDTVARLGGDEFTVILPGFHGRTHLERIAQDIINALAQPFDLSDGESGYISASIGITLCPDDATEREQLVRHADQAMYAAKAAGRGRFHYFTPSMQEEARTKLELSNDLRHALAREELRVHYQPIVEIASGAVVKAEALLRWERPARGMIGPDVFIPLAEESGLIHQIGEWVFQEAITSMERWRAQFGRIIQLSVNMSGVQFEKIARYSWMDRLHDAGFPPGSLTAEITEDVLTKDAAAVKQRLLEFWRCGIEVSIDDFGMGFSALPYLKQLDIDYLKLDRLFVSRLAENMSDRALTEAIIVMAHKLGIKTIAEGVETKEQLDILAGFGCDYAQGFYFSMALPREQFERLLSQPEPFSLRSAHG